MSFDTLKSSGEKTADAAILVGHGVFGGIVVATDGTNAVTVSIYDNASTASGTELIPTTVFTTGAADRKQYLFPPRPIEVENGIYVDITIGGGSCGYTVYYR